MYLIDTNVLSEFRKAESGRVNARVASWAAQTAVNSMHLSVVTILELQIGALRIERRDPAQSSLLRKWINDYVMQVFAGRILSADLEIAFRCASLHVPDKRPERDAWIAATAMVHGMTVVTRNVSDFKLIGVAVVNPWEF